MRQPLWVVNSSLLIILLLSEIALVLLQVSIPRRASLTPTVVHEVEKKAAFEIDVKKIYAANDLFDTYVPEVPVLVKEVEFKVPPIPEIPPLIPLSIPVEKQPVFIAPLAATLKGIVYLHDDQDKSVAIIQLNNSKQESNYKVGEFIQDAQILKILPNRVIVIRSNGQQETLYLREADAKKDLSQEENKGIAAMNVIAQKGTYFVPVDTFVAHVRSLGQFIDLLDITTVYKKGVSVGCRIGKANKGSLAYKLGLQLDDVIVRIDDIPVANLNSRIEVYDHIISKQVGSSIEVEIERGNKPLRLKYVLTDQQDQRKVEQAEGKIVGAPLESGTVFDIEQQKKRILEQKVKLAPTAHQIKMDEQKKLLEARRKNLLTNKFSSIKN